jgi:hypothetical protein
VSALAFAVVVEFSAALAAEGEPVSGFVGPEEAPLAGIVSV